MRFRTWMLRVCCIRAIKSVVGELEKCKLHLVGVQEVRWEGEGKNRRQLHIFMETEMLITTWGKDFS
jgi:hypothetical protein